MMSSRFIFLAAAALILSALACGAPVGAPADDTPVVDETPTPLPPTPTPIPPELTPTPQPEEPVGPRFSGPVRFTTDPDGGDSLQTFPAGVEEIWAVWDYEGMSEGDVMRRVWYQDGAVWIEREEAWDMATYGAKGTVRNISIYDHEDGLPPGQYRLELFINGVQQTVDPSTFSIASGETTGGTDAIAFPSPDRSRTAIIQPPGTLVLDEIDGESRTLAQHGEIIDVEWFPDGDHLLYVTLDRGDAPDGPTIGWVWEIWAINVVSEERWSISQGDQTLHDPAISPGGDVIAVVAGTGYGDAGLVDTTLAFVYLDTSLRRNALVIANEFNGIPDDSVGSVYPVAGGGLALPGEWTSITEFHANMAMTWQAGDFEPGVYAFFMRDRMAGRIADLPDDVVQ
jgi:hypothetical protein